MADLLDRLPQNVPGRFFIDSTCVDCGMCPEDVPAVFRRHDEIGQTFVHHQPETAEEVQLCLEAVSNCPVEAIGDLETS
ncbi:ferredoxin [Brevifollis gellanilyticus]|uniref:Ferredoxin n=1 Tax=Brevifollis gellanilyticus TaxID=748831 RepID=A0A512M4P1_9BACT|nr:ferredoxin [Brevifollis gellanilyticus]GEP41688.1 ferredoxin [Brevifollis gellanilyticus]